MIKVSVIVPVYNVEKYLAKCLDTVCNQTFSDYEVVIINDGSPDNSEKIINDYIKKYNNIKYYKKKNGGLSDARNYGISKSNGKYLMFIDSDDYVSNDMVEKLYNKIEEEKADMALCNYILIKPDKSEYKNYNYNPGTTNIYKNKKILLNKQTACNKIYKKELFNDLLFDKGKYYEDLRIMIKLYSKCNRIAFIDDFCYYYVERNNSIMHDCDVEKNFEIVDAINSIMNYYKNEKIYDNFFQEIEFIMIDNVIISNFVRIICSNNNYKFHLGKYLSFIEDNFPNYKKNSYIKELAFKRKLVFFLNSRKLYFITRLLFKLRRQ